MKAVEKGSRFKDPEEWFHCLATHYVEAQIYFHLNQCGAFQKLQGGSTASELASELGLNEHVLKSLLEYAADIGEIVSVDAAGRFGLTLFGRTVVERYGKSYGNRVVYNMFDVRVGAWGPVWTNLGELLRNTKTYGVDVHRAGDYAADGLFKLAGPLAAAVDRAADKLGASTVVELGPTSGILAQLAAKPGDKRRYVGVDVKQESLDWARRLASEQGIDSVAWHRGDVFAPSGWLQELEPDGRVLYFSCHFHEFLSLGAPVLEQALQVLTTQPQTAGILALEQPRPEQALRSNSTPTQWLYGQSNVLIHHLIKNARILYRQEWRELLRRGGCPNVWVEETATFGFSAFVGATSFGEEGRRRHVQHA
jgi:hypothetical protein